MEQNTTEWSVWRHKLIGASDVAAVLGISPWKTPLQLYEEKILPEPPKFEPNAVMQKGNRLEPIARAQFELSTGKEYSPHLLQLDSYPFIGCSLDGYCKEDDTILELKFVGKERDGIPPHYMAQIQSQLMISKAKYAWYQSYGELGASVQLHAPIRVDHDTAMQAKILAACIAFWECVTKRTPPEAEARDYVPITDPILPERLITWRRLKAEAAGLQARIDELETFAKGLVTSPHMYCGNIRFTKTTRRGAVDYRKVPELQGVDLEKYRGKSTEYVTMRIGDDK